MFQGPTSRSAVRLELWKKNMKLPTLSVRTFTKCWISNKAVRNEMWSRLTALSRWKYSFAMKKGSLSESSYGVIRKVMFILSTFILPTLMCEQNPQKKLKAGFLFCFVSFFVVFRQHLPIEPWPSQTRDVNQVGHGLTRGPPASAPLWPSLPLALPPALKDWD